MRKFENIDGLRLYIESLPKKKKWPSQQKAAFTRWVKKLPDSEAKTLLIEAKNDGRSRTKVMALLRALADDRLWIVPEPEIKAAALLVKAAEAAETGSLDDLDAVLAAVSEVDPGLAMQIVVAKATADAAANLERIKSQAEETVSCLDNSPEREDVELVDALTDEPSGETIEGVVVPPKEEEMSEEKKPPEQPVENGPSWLEKTLGFATDGIDWVNAYVTQVGVKLEEGREDAKASLAHLGLIRRYAELIGPELEECLLAKDMRFFPLVLTEGPLKKLVEKASGVMTRGDWREGEFTPKTDGDKDVLSEWITFLAMHAAVTSGMVPEDCSFVVPRGQVEEAHKAQSDGKVKDGLSKLLEAKNLGLAFDALKGAPLEKDGELSIERQVVEAIQGTKGFSPPRLKKAGAGWSLVATGAYEPYTHFLSRFQQELREMKKSGDGGVESAMPFSNNKVKRATMYGWFMHKVISAAHQPMKTLGIPEAIWRRATVVLESPKVVRKTSKGRLSVPKADRGRALAFGCKTGGQIVFAHTAAFATQMSKGPRAFGNATKYAAYMVRAVLNQKDGDIWKERAGEAISLAKGQFFQFLCPQWGREFIRRQYETLSEYLEQKAGPVTKAVAKPFKMVYRGAEMTFETARAGWAFVRGEKERTRVQKLKDWANRQVERGVALKDRFVGFLGRTLNRVKHPIQALIDAKDWVVDQARNGWDKVKAAYTWTKEAVVGTAKKVGEKARSAWRWLTSRLSSADATAPVC